MKQETYQQLYVELEKYENSGVHINLEDCPASPMQIVSAHLMEERPIYMRDYQWDEQGKVRALTFHNIKES